MATFDEFPQLETKRLLLRRIMLDDTDAIFRIFSDDAVTEHYDLSIFRSLDQASNLIDRINQRYERDESIRWGIVSKDDNGLIGTCGFNVLYRYTFRAGIGYDLARSAWGQGYMTEALRAMLRYGFEQMELHRVEAMVMPGNDRSVRVLEKLGFEEEGTLRDYGYWKGRFWDLRLFALLKGDLM